MSNSDSSTNRYRKYKRLRKTFLSLGMILAIFALLTTLTTRPLAFRSDYCSAVIDRPGQVRVGEPFRVTVKVVREQCSPAAFDSTSVDGMRLEVSSIPAGDYVEAKLQSRVEMSIKPESELSKPIPADGPATWTWELVANRAENYSFSLQFVLRDAENEKDIRESDARYFTIEAIDSNWEIVKKTATGTAEFLTGLSGALTSLSAILLLLASFFGFKERAEARATAIGSNET